MLCLVISFLCSLQAYNYTRDITEHLYFCALNSSPPTHFTRAPPSPAKNRYLNSRLMILHASKLATELFDKVQSPRYVFGSVSSQPKASKFSEKCQGRSTFLASLPQWVGHFQRLGYGQVRLPDGEKGHQFESNSIKPKRDTRKRIGQCLQG